MHSLEEIGAKMDALDLWESLASYNWAVRPHGTVFPYFCNILKGEGSPVKVRFLMLEGWQTLHDFLRTRVDRNFGYYSTPMELPHFELIVLDDGSTKVFRHDSGYMPRPVNASERDFVSRILWEAYGLMMRLETDPRLPMCYAEDKAIFSRVEVKPGVWKDGPLPIVDPHPVTERVAFSKDDLKVASDLPLSSSETLEVDFHLMPGVMTQDRRPLCVYELVAFEETTGQLAFSAKVSTSPTCSLKDLWENVPVQVLKCLIRRGHIPHEIKLLSGRLFRLMRPLSEELPFRLSLHDVLPHIRG